jgi:hypothetical protein
MSARSWLIVALLVAAVSACEDEAVHPPRLDQIGDPCRTASRTCVDDDSVRRCEDGIWAVATCAQVCAELGPAYLADGCEQDCVCILAEPDGCIPNETTCMDDDTLGTCSPTQAWEPSSCADRCAASQLASLGCFDSGVESDDPAGCWCTALGTPCGAAPASCVDDSTLAMCIDGNWVFEDCALLCDGPAECDPWLRPAACSC